MLLVLVLMFKILFTEARVFCEDNNALLWKPLGPSCPITCSTVKSAVERLRLRDYRYLISNKDKKQVNMSAADLYILGQELHGNIYNRRLNFLHPDTRKHIKLYQTYHRLLSNENFEHALKIEAGKMTAEFNKTCSNMAAKDLFNKKIVNVKCTRKLNKRSDALEKFTKFLNVFADPKYPFDEEMAGIILQKLEGNLNLRYGVVDYKVLLAYLRKTLKYHKTQSTGDRIIKLQSKNCLNIYQAGCYCKNGFVENQGQCVKPEDCLASSMQIKYLERIIFY